MSHLKNEATICDELHQLCVAHQKYIEQQLENEMDSNYSIAPRYFPNKIFLTTCNYGGKEFTKPSYFELKIRDQNKTSINKQQRMELLINKYDVIEDLRLTLIHDPLSSDGEPLQKLKLFNQVLTKPETKNIICAHKDSLGWQFVQKTAYLISSVFFGAGLIYSFKTKGSCAFWKSRGEVVFETMKDALEPFDLSINQNQITSP